jgi:gamma-glutamylcyclotransferase (GGCT)/AIG2-like uncharacterized protein YtfP
MADEKTGTGPKPLRLRVQKLHQLFVYGTMMRGEPNHGVVRRMGPLQILLAETPGRLIDVGGYPAFLPPTGPDQWVQGELVTIPHQRIRPIFLEADQLEGAFPPPPGGPLFRRERCRAGFYDGDSEEAWLYAWTRASAGFPPIPSGDWRQHHGRRDAFLEGLVAQYCGDLDEAAFAWWLMQSAPVAPPNPAEYVRSLLPLADAIRRGDLTERDLAQVGYGPRSVH